jgi:uncharacterized protein (DUF983 family)
VDSSAPPSPELIADNAASTLLRAAMNLRCLVCKTGRVHESWFRYVDRCPTCGATFCREQGFFLGSIYFNYGATVLFATTAWFLFGGLERGATFSSFVPFAAFCVVFPLWFLRYARSLFAALDQYFDPRGVDPKPRDQSSI